MAENESVGGSAAQIEIAKVRSFLAALEEQDTLIMEGLKGRQTFPASMAQLIVIKGIFEDILTYQPNLVRPFHVHADANGLRSQIRDARLRVVAKLEELAPRTENPAQSAVEKLFRSAEAPDKRRVFVVYGRNMEARNAMFAFLRAINLDPIEWEEAISMTGQTTPYTGNALEVAFSRAQAAVVMLTGDDLARLGRRHLTHSDPPEERRLMPQARPNVLFEAGMAFGRYPERTLLVALGVTRPFSDIAGLHIVNITNAISSRQKLADRLKIAKCDVRIDYKADWHNAGDFDSARYNPDIPSGPNPFRLRVVSRRATFDEKAQYQRKVWFHVRNDSDDCLEICHSGWNPGSGGIKAKIVSSTLQLKLGTTWCPEKQGIERLHLPAGESLQTWVDPAPEYTPQDLDDRCQAEASVGSLILLVNGIEVALAV